MLSRTPEFTSDESSVALELMDAWLERGESSGYIALVMRGALEGYGEDALLGYACVGPTPMTHDTWDLYWIVTAPEARGQGIGRALHEACLTTMRAAGAARVRIETSTREGYGATLAFYDRLGYHRVGLIPDFYAPGDDLVTQLFMLS